MYKHLKDEKSRIARMRMPTGRRLSSVFTGFYEKPFLCDECEDKIDKWESYAEKVLNGTTHFNTPVTKSTADPLIQVIENIDYKKFKLFLLSILWRSSASTHEFFREVSLGKEHQGRMAEMLINEDPGEENEYPVMLVFAKGAVGRDISIGQPYKNKSKENAVRYIFPIAEVIYVYHISKHGLQEPHKTAYIKKDDTMKIVFWPVSRLNAFLNLYNVRKSIMEGRRAKLFGRRI
ncbi:hypothetical protein [Pedobacter panaciterrae]|uniref:hypothetical protein n=1 Tax=Pedobacter panaciterrae TaxID=363849 RepID=UPI002594910F|nr:hypothetical protein [uncultured Pedobacter sp.]